MWSSDLQLSFLLPLYLLCFLYLRFIDALVGCRTLSACARARALGVPCLPSSVLSVVRRSVLCLCLSRVPLLS